MSLCDPVQKPVNQEMAVSGHVTVHNAPSNTLNINNLNGAGTITNNNFIHNQFVSYVNVVSAPAVPYSW